MAKSSNVSDEKKAEKSANYICSECKTEFYGVECPQCGNRKENLKLAPDGIDQASHRPGVIFGNASGLRHSEDIVDHGLLMSQRQAAIQAEELNNNLRETYVLRSEIKKRELELERMRKEREYNDAKSALDSGKAIPSGAGTGVGIYQSPQEGGAGAGASPLSPFPYMAQMSPQAVFMTQLMKMDKDKRAEFLAQLSDADPQALVSLSSMMGTPQMPGMAGMGMPGMPNMPGMQSNPYMMSMMYPWMMNQMMQQQQQHNQPQTDPLETAMSLVSTIFELSQKAQPKTDDATKDMIKELKDELKQMRQRDTPSSSSIDLKPVLDKMSELEKRVAIENKHSVVDSLAEITSLVTGLESIGLVQKPGSAGKSVDDEIKLKKLDHEIQRDNKTLDIENKRIDAEKARAAMGQAVISSLFQRSLSKAVKDKDGNTTTAAPSAVRKVSLPSPSAPVPKVVVEEIQTESGSIKETRSPVKRE